MVTLSRSPVRSDPSVMGGMLVFRASRVLLEMFPSVNREDAAEFFRLVRGETDADRP